MYRELVEFKIILTILFTAIITLLQDLLAVGYGQFEFTEQKGGLICCWSLKNPEVGSYSSFEWEKQILTEWENDRYSQNHENHENPHASSKIIHCWKQEELFFKNM